MGKQQLTLLLRALSIQIKENFIHKWIYTFRLLLPLPSLAQLLLNQDITMDMVMVMDMVDMDTMDTMEREKLSLATIIMAMDMDTDMVDMVIMATMERGKPMQLLLLSQDTTTMDTAIMEDMATMDIMERERLKPPLLLSQDIIIMAMDMVMDMVDMVIMDTMEREKLRLATIMVMDMGMDMVDMVTMAIMERERLSPVIIIMVMGMVMVMATVMDTMVKQQLFIDSSIFSIIDLDFLKSSLQKHTIIKTNKIHSLKK